MTRTLRTNTPRRTLGCSFLHYTLSAQTAGCPAAVPLIQRKSSSYANDAIILPRYFGFSLWHVCVLEFCSSHGLAQLAAVFFSPSSSLLSHWLSLLLPLSQMKPPHPHCLGLWLLAVAKTATTRQLPFPSRYSTNKPIMCYFPSSMLINQNAILIWKGTWSFYF